MTITSYWMTADAALDFVEKLDNDGHDEMSERVHSDIEERYSRLFPDGFGDAAEIAYASRFERDVMDMIDRYAIPHETHVVETDD